MSWMSQLYETYEMNMGGNQQDEIMLTPLAHMHANAQIEVLLTNNGFKGASKVDKKDAVTLIPVTESSAGRASGIAPHALSDTLSYIAGDYSDYCKSEKERTLSQKKHQEYMNQLEGWIKSSYKHSSASIVYQYLSKKELISDLIKSGIITLTENGMFDDKKISGQPYEKAIVRFCILGADGNQKLWEDQSLINSYISYVLSVQTGKKDICYLSGKERLRAENHPKGIIAANYGAKLVSANDNQGFTYRGRFQNAEQAYALSYEASQKVHSALTWLAKKQGVSVGTSDKRTYVCWNPKGKKVPDILNPLGLIDDEESTDVPYRKKLYKTLQGYRNQFQEDEGVVIIGLDAATTGRLSITYYNELLASDFFDRILYWGNTCNWPYLKFTEQKKPYYKTETPLIRRIAECAFGREQGKFIELGDKILKEQTQRLLKCMLDKQPMPTDIMRSLVIRVSSPMSYSRSNRERVLSTACAVIVKYYIDRGILKKGEDNEMKLDLENRDRSYLYGRLLAIFEKIERTTYERGESREPNAIRLQSAYVNHPLQTWKILEDALKPYFQKMRPGSREYYRRLISDITMLFCESDKKVMNQSLSENYVLGYYLQRAELNKKITEQKEETENE